MFVYFVYNIHNDRATCLDIILSIPREVDINVISFIFISTIRSYENRVSKSYRLPLLDTSNLSVVLRSVDGGDKQMVAE